MGLERRQLCEQAVYLAGGVVVNDADSHGTARVLDGHAARMKRQTFLEHLSTPEGTKELTGGYMGLSW